MNFRVVLGSLLVLAGACAVGACSSDDTIADAMDAGNAGGAAGSSVGGAAGSSVGGAAGEAGGAGQGGSAGSAGTAGAAGACTGDQPTWTALTTAPIACKKNSDCCVIINSCTSETQVVAFKDQAAAKAAWPNCGECTACIPPATEVGCTGGVCTSREVDFSDASPDLLQDHCGVDGPEIPVGALHFTCG